MPIFRIFPSESIVRSVTSTIASLMSGHFVRISCFVTLPSVWLYVNVDWRMGDETDFNFGDGRRASVDMSGWYWGVGAVVSF